MPEQVSNNLHDSRTAQDPEPELEVRKGILWFNDVPVGRLDGETLILNLGWTKMAKLGIRCMADPEVERPRGGIAFER